MFDFLDSFLNVTEKPAPKNCENIQKYLIVFKYLRVLIPLRSMDHRLRASVSYHYKKIKPTCHHQDTILLICQYLCKYETYVIKLLSFTNGYLGKLNYIHFSNESHLDFGNNLKKIVENNVYAY